MADSANGPVYKDTTERNSSAQSCLGLSTLKLPRLIFKVAQLLLSLTAFICEEIVEHCTQCGGLYFFEFVSCSALFLSILALLVYCTRLHEKLGLEKVKKLDWWFTLVVGILFLLASIVFAATNDATTLEKVSIAFGFLASLAFLIDLVFIVKEGIKPCQKAAKKPSNTNGGKAQGPETLALTTEAK
ncbi:CKLF-like MARVEL transmembrane domain-containing protein 6 [Rhinatrema bivittatum]|uniref:CKLF-like MARVEL transmembrane domain-containing protein 6 n=1 Tax=Rhinatrema bivittatum TaxID=194408 RepID=UPI00112A68F2|nr:CKLF-like MARVEL transmembrane domain-containing protein 6 [Rhinatrema bivittatum]